MSAWTDVMSHLWPAEWDHRRAWHAAQEDEDDQKCRMHDGPRCECVKGASTSGLLRDACKAEGIENSADPRYPEIEARTRADWHASRPIGYRTCRLPEGSRCECTERGEACWDSIEEAVDNARALGRCAVADILLDLWGTADLRTWIDFLDGDEGPGAEITALVRAGAAEACTLDLKAYKARRYGNNGAPVPVEAFLAAEIEREPKRVERVRMGFDDLAQLPPMPALIDGLLDQSSITMLLGKGGSYKSFTALGWSLAIATGEPWCGHDTGEPRTVTYVAGEDMRGQHGRTTAYLSGHGLDAPDATMLSFVPGIQLDHAAEVEALIADCRERGDALIVLDTLHKMTANLDENSNTAMGVALAAIERIRTETGAAVLVLHHTGHEGARARGASALEDDADTVWLLSGDGDRRRELVCRKQRNAERPAPRRLEFVKCAGSGYVRLLDAAADGGDHVIEVAAKQVLHGGPITPEQAVLVLDAMNCPRGVGERPTLAFIRENKLAITASVARAAVKLRKAA